MNANGVVLRPAYLNRTDRFGYGPISSTSKSGSSSPWRIYGDTRLTSFCRRPRTCENRGAFQLLTGEPNIWTSGGAFVDSGFIGVGETVETFSPGTFKRAKVISPIVSNSDGSTIIWKFNEVWSFTSETTLIQHGQWHIVEGTGRYAGIRGQGDVEGDMDIVTGAITDVFHGLG